jgi:hypothetical protein
MVLFLLTLSRVLYLNCHHPLHKIDFEVVNSYTTDLSGIYNIITVDDKSTWVNDVTKKVIRQINIDNDNITTTKQIRCVGTRCEVITRFYDTYYNTIVTSHMDSQG